MSSPGDSRAAGVLDSIPQDLDWANLVREMREMKDHIEGALDKPAPNASAVGGSSASQQVSASGAVPGSLSSSGVSSAAPTSQAASAAAGGVLAAGAPAPAFEPPAPGDAPMEEMLSGLPTDEADAPRAGIFEQSSSSGTESSASGAPLAAVLPLARPGTSAGGVGTTSGAVPSAAAQESALSLAVMGALKLRLELTRQSQTVQIHIEETELRVELSDGMQFRIPLNKAA